MRILKRILISVGIVVGLLAWIWFSNFPYVPSCTFRYKLAADVQTPDGVKSAASVIEVKYGYQRPFGGGDGRLKRAWGDALFFDLGAGKNLVLTLTSQASGREPGYDEYSPQGNPAYPSSNVFGLPLQVFKVLSWPANSRSRSACKTLHSQPLGQAFDIPLNMLPTLLTFGDLADPYSITIVQPEDLQATFGPGYKMLRASLTPTDEAMVQTIRARFPWWDRMVAHWKKHGIYYDAINITPFIERRSGKVFSADGEKGSY